jgi:hypothetical protein
VGKLSCPALVAALPAELRPTPGSTLLDEDVLRRLLEAVFARATDPYVLAAREYLGWTRFDYARVHEIVLRDLPSAKRQLNPNAPQDQHEARLHRVLKTVTARRRLASAIIDPPDGVVSKTVKNTYLPKIATALLQAIRSYLNTPQEIEKAESEVHPQSSTSEAPPSIEENLKTDPESFDPETTPALAQEGRQTSLAVADNTHPRRVRFRRMRNGVVYWWLSVFALLLLFATFTMSDVMPASTSPKLQPIDMAARWLVLFCLLPGWVLAQLQRRRRYLHWRFGAGFLVVIFLLCLSLASIHIYCFYVETRLAREVMAQARDGQTVYIDNFDDDGPCPDKDSPNDMRIPLTSCQIGGRVATAVVEDPLVGSAFGIHMSQNRLNRFPFTVRFDQRRYYQRYYVEVRYRAIKGTDIAGCGLAIESRTSPQAAGPDWLSYVRVLPKNDGYRPQVLIAPIKLSNPVEPNASTRVIPNHTAMGAIALPFVLKRSWPGGGYGAWIKVAAILDNDKTTILVDDRVVLVFREPTTVRYSKVGVGVGEPTTRTAVTSECEFDYVHVRTLPSVVE